MSTCEWGDKNTQSSSRKREGGTRGGISPRPVVAKHHPRLKRCEKGPSNHAWASHQQNLVEHFLENMDVHGESRFENQRRKKDVQHQVRVQVRDCGVCLCPLKSRSAECLMRRRARERQRVHVLSGQNTDELVNQS